MNHSILYNFCSEGAFADLGLPITCVIPTPDQCVRLFGHQLKHQEILPDKVFANIKLQVLLDKLHWIATSVKIEGCAKCRPEHTVEGQEDVVPPYFSKLSWKLVEKSFLARTVAQNMLAVAR
jgi:hypothetical protein